MSNRRGRMRARARLHACVVRACLRARTDIAKRFRGNSVQQLSQKSYDYLSHHCK